MKLQIRKGVFETNSSSVHCMTMCSKSDFDDWKDGKLVYDYKNECLIPSNDSYYQEWLNDVDKEDDYPCYYTFHDFMNMDRFETFYDSYNNVVAFGYFGNDW